MAKGKRREWYCLAGKDLLEEFEEVFCGFEEVQNSIKIIGIINK